MATVEPVLGHAVGERSTDSVRERKPDRAVREREQEQARAERAHEEQKDQAA